MKNSAAPWIAWQRRERTDPPPPSFWLLRRRLGRAVRTVPAHAASPAVHRTAPFADGPAGPLANTISVGVALGGSAAAPALALALTLALALPLLLALTLGGRGLATVLSVCQQAGEKDSRRKNAAYGFHVTTSDT
jgi:hypothetical protein